MHPFFHSFPRSWTAGILTGFYTFGSFLIVTHEHDNCFQNFVGDFHFCGFGTALILPLISIEASLSIKLGVLLIQSFFID